MSEPRLKNIKEANMPNIDYGANEFTVEELEELFKDDEPQQETPPANNNETNPHTEQNAETGADNSVTNTQAFSRRLKESTDKARREEREAIAKSLGYESYEDMTKKREQELYNSNGLNAEDVSPVVEQIVKQRLENDPRMLELEMFKEARVKEFGKKELAEITKLTNGEITSLSQLPKDVIELWKQKGSLKAAYMELEGEKLITKIRSEQSKGSVDHMNTPHSSTAAATNKRPLTDEEKRVWKFFNPTMTNEELSKITVDN
jgi:hypothetical protein